jgi:hypothetical protein
MPRRQRAEERPPRFLLATRQPDECRLLYFATKRDCDAGALMPKCCPNRSARKIVCSVEAAREKARAIAKNEGYVTSRRERKKVEMLFASEAHPRSVSCACADRAETSQNLRNLAKLIPTRRSSCWALWRQPTKRLRRAPRPWPKSRKALWRRACSRLYAGSMCLVRGFCVGDCP